MSERRKVVIVGGGFGGLSAAQHLHSNLVDVTVIDRRNYHLFQPLLYQVATGSLSPGEIASPLRSVLSRQKNTRVWLGTVVNVDPDLKRVILADGTIVPYDALIIAAGSETSYFGHNDWQQWARGLKSIEEATTIRHKILYAFEVAKVARRASFSFRSRRIWADLPIIFERSLKGRAAQPRNALSAVAKAFHICSSVCSVKVLSTSPVAGLTLLYGILDSSACFRSASPHLLAGVMCKNRASLFCC
jgi:hypothetical protein